MKLPATLVCVVIAASGCETKKPVPSDAKIADAVGAEAGGCELFCIQSPIDGGVTCQAGCADAGGVCPPGCEPIG